MSPGPLVVIGDALLDVDLRGNSRRRTPDAAVPVVEDADVRHRPGGAALAAWLAARQGVPVVLIAAVGEDAAGERLAGLLHDTVALTRLPLCGRTPVKTRVFDGERPLLRVDDGDGRAAADGPADRVLAALEEARAVLVSDYGRGVAELPAVRERLAACAANIPIVWDPHPAGPPPVPGTRLVTPNAAEAGVTEGDSAAGLERAAELARGWQADAVAITLGGDGAVWAGSGGKGGYLPAPPVGPADDVCGAGDRFASCAAAALGDGADTAAVVGEAVEAASRFVAAGGAGAATTVGPMTGALPMGLSEGAVEVAERIRRAGGRVIAAGGCFDVLHAGHVSLLRRARALGDCLIVCINGDAAIRRLKGPDRPLTPLHDRIRVLTALECVDAVAVFDDPTPSALLERLRPDVWVKGGDYAITSLPEAPVVSGYGGEVVLLPLLPGRSTTGLVTAMRATGR
ncbi:rfaE bifunctional protein, domain II [Marinactinospora thermotolerans DSM 45154]|uniref:RfaE bifunctional protein, domain II n=1 Tax=Marinactinospora thermotolerans DSM 45154 TaxID=1122192 RepID=A0A1T4K4X5_9ACTN|nr:PfkB family carbohydrate kinase [Marinactinospora thermotolerans]SJZ37456.1 rfaE bifunctional protein, domain II [Marinactinospora thermotolerans DSM 45154]